MRGEIRRSSERGNRAVEFCIANPSPEPSYIVTVTQLKGLVARVDQLGVQQRAGRNDAHAAVTRRYQVRLHIEYSLLAPLIKVGRLAAKDAPEELGKFRLTQPHGNYKSFLINARGMLASAVAAKDLLVSKGLAANLIDDLTKALDTFEAEGDAINLSRRAHIAARAELDDVTVRMADLVNVLDGFNRYRFQNDPELLVAWNAARTVVAHSPRKNGITPPADGATKAA